MGESEKGIRVTVEDLETGETHSNTIWNNYLIVVAGSCHIAHENLYLNSGTVQLTIKGVAPSLRCHTPSTAAASTTQRPPTGSNPDDVGEVP